MPLGHRQPRVVDRVEPIALPAALLAGAPLLLAPEWFPGLHVWVLLTSLAACGIAALLLRRWPLLACAVAVIALTAYAGSLRASRAPEALASFAGLSFGLLAMSAAAAWCRTKARLMVAIAAFLVAGAVALPVGLAGVRVRVGRLFFDLPAEYSIREAALFLPSLQGPVNSNVLGATALMFLAVAAAMAFPPSRHGIPVGLRILGGAVAVFAVGLIVAVQSVSVWLASCVLLLVAALRLRRVVWLSLAVACLVGVLGVGAVVAVQADQTNAYEVGKMLRETSREAAARRTRLQVRVDIWRQGLTKLEGAPLTGIGLNEFRRVYTPARDNLPNVDIAHAHNILLQTGLDLGLVGLGAYVLLVLILLGRAARTAATFPDGLISRTALGAGLAVAGVHAFGLTDAIPLGTKVGLFQWGAAGLILAALNVGESEAANAYENEFRDGNIGRRATAADLSPSSI